MRRRSDENGEFASRVTYSGQYNYSTDTITMPTLAVHDKVSFGVTRNKTVVPLAQPLPGNGNFQRLKVEDALSYLDQVKYRFNTQPQVYNDFLDIMKEFKSQSIDTPGVITRVSNLFKGHPELIMGFNTFLPPGYKIEVQSSEAGYSFQVSVSVTESSACPSPTESILQTSIATIESAAANVTKAPVFPTPTAAPPIIAPPPPPPPPPKPTPITSAVASFTSTQAQQAVSQALIHVESGSTQPLPPNQPVEFNHAINYVNKIKNRFQGQPDKYKRFLEILHTYQKEQRTLKENQQFTCSGKNLTEAEVYSQVAKLFENQEDLLAEFGQFLPDATSHQTTFNAAKNNNEHYGGRKPFVSKTIGIGTPNFNSNSTMPTPKLNNTSPPNSLKRSASTTCPSITAPPTKKVKSPSFKDIPLSDAHKYGSLNDFAFFDRVRKVTHPETYKNFLRCLNIYNNELINRSELLQLTTPFLQPFPELLRWFTEFLGTEPPPGSNAAPLKEDSKTPPPHSYLDQMSNNLARSGGEHASVIDYSTCKRIGASYCAVPDDFRPPKCSGRTPLCHEVLNDQWVSFPTWSEEATFVTSKKTQYEEYIYRCEDERFELDFVIETNASTIGVFEAIQKRFTRLSAEEIAKVRLDDCLGGTSPTIHQRSIQRIYGDKTPDIIEGLKKNPAAAIPVVLKRLKAKEEEWREAQKGFNKIWRDQNEKFYLKSLDHQGMNFKQNDMKYLRSKSLINEIEALYDDRLSDENTTAMGPHLVLPYRDKTVLDDAANLLIHHVKRQTSIHKDDKQKIKLLIRQFVPDLFYHPRQELSDDERDEGKPVGNEKEPSPENDEKPYVDGSPPLDSSKMPLHVMGCHPDERYTLFYVENHWYLFLRLHQILCDRLSKMYDRAMAIARQAESRDQRRESTAIALRLKPRPDIEVEDYYPAMLDMVKNVLDGNMDANSYEDTLREMFGIYAYVAFTLDKVVSHAVRQLQHLVGDDPCNDCYETFLSERCRGATGGACRTAYRRVTAEAAYHRRVEAFAFEACYRVYVYKIDCKLTVECLDTDGDDKWPAEEEKTEFEFEEKNEST